ncbi:MAG TPA: BatD family protein [Gemmatimonadales bacterium]|nr:BatD family protein [Gemmatimonadales bacterium]
MIAAVASVACAALLLGVQQDERPQLDASVDEDRISVGEELTYTLRAVSHSPVPMQVTLAPFTGLEIVERSERTEVGFRAGAVRTTILEIRLRAVRPGHWQIGPARAVQGRDTVEAGPVIIDVAANRAATATALGPRIRALLDHAAPPPPGQPGVDLLVSTDSVRVGEQVDVVTAAWFPRDLRLQLRRPPTLQPPVIDGVWSFPQNTPSGIAATRNIRGRWYDLFVSHQVVFPLVPGTVGIPRATLKYSTPVALQFFSQEERFALSSPADTLVVRALPSAGRPTSFGGAIGSTLRLERRVDPATASVGEGLAVELRLTGEGNTALWPTPDLRWPTGVRAYLERVDEQVRSTDGRVGGTKTFRYLVVPDSAGALALPGVRYGYFDLATDRYAELALTSSLIPVVSRSESAAAAALPPALLHQERPAVPWSAAHGVPDWAWMLLLLLPPLLLAIRSRAPSLRFRRRASTAPARTDLGGAEAALDELVQALSPDPGRRFGPSLAAAVRAAGADAELAARLTRVRERLLARRYGPAGTAAEDAQLASEAHDVVRQLGGSLRGWGGRGVAVGLLVGISVAANGVAQNPAPEQLYSTGALHAAAEGFARRAAEEPAVAGHWYNLGATYYRLGATGRAEAAWLRARRLDPRNGSVRRALALTPPPDVASARWTWSPPVTPEELLLVGALAWLAGWVGWVVRPRARERWLVLLVFAGAAVLGGLALRQWYRRPLAIVLDSATLRLSPHGRAPALVPVDGGSAVRVVSRTPGWVLVRAAGGREGWVPDAAVAVVGG